MRFRTSYLTLTALLVAGGSLAHAQTSTTGAIEGKVLDASGQPVAGATVRLVGSQISRSTQTAPDGTFRVGLLNPAVWKVVISAPGYVGSTQSIELHTNETRSTNFKLAKEAAAQVEVIGSAAAIDATSTKTGLTVTMESITAVPKGRDVTSVVFLAPGTVDGGFGGTNASIAGASAAENTFIVDGLNTTDFRTGFHGATLPTDFVDQVEVQTGGFKPEFSALGGVFNVIVKSGTNDFKGSAWATWDPRNLRAKPKDNQYFVAAAAADRNDYGFEVSGPLIKDRLFYFIGVSEIDTKEQAKTNKYPGLSISPHKTTDSNVMAKLNAYITQEQQITLTFQYNPFKDDLGQTYPAYGTANYGNKADQNSQNISLNYDITITPSLLLSFKAGQNLLTRHDRPFDTTNVNVADSLYFTPYNPGNPGGADPFTNYTTGGFDSYEITNNNLTKQLKADLSWFIGNHNLKFGWSFLQSRYVLVNRQSGGYDLSTGVINDPNAPPPPPTELALFQTYFSDNSSVFAKFNAYYAQDTWEVTPGLRIFYGARFETQEQFGDKGYRIFKFDKLSDYLQPRLGFSWDVNNDGRSKLSGSYAVYYESMPQRLAVRSYANETFVKYTFDANASGFSYDPSNPNHYGTVSGGLTPANAVNTTNYGPLFSYDAIADNIKLPQRKEIVLGYEQQLGTSLTMGVHAKWRKLTHVIEDSVITDASGNYLDPTGHAILWNPGSSVSYTTNPAYDPSPAHYSSNNTLFPTAYNEYRSYDLTMAWKADRLSLDANYTWSRLKGNYEGVVSSSNQQPDGNITASFDYYPYVGTGLLPLDREHVFKAFGGYRFSVGPDDLNAGFNLAIQSGTPVSLFDDGSTSAGLAPGTLGVGNIPYDIGYYGNATPANGKLGQYGRTPTTTDLGLHLDLVHKIDKIRIIPAVDMFNALNTRKATAVTILATDGNATPQPNWNKPSAYQDGRSLRFSVRIQF